MSLTTAVVGAEPSVISTVGVCSSQAVFAVTYFQIPNDEVEGLIQYVKFAGSPVGSDETGLNAFKSTSARDIYAAEA